MTRCRSSSGATRSPNASESWRLSSLQRRRNEILSSIVAAAPCSRGRVIRTRPRSTCGRWDRAASQPPDVVVEPRADRSRPLVMSSGRRSPNPSSSCSPSIRSSGSTRTSRACIRCASPPDGCDRICRTFAAFTVLRPGTRRSGKTWAGSATSSASNRDADVLLERLRALTEQTAERGERRPAARMRSRRSATSRTRPRSTHSTAIGIPPLLDRLVDAAASPRTFTPDAGSTGTPS